MAEIFRVQVEVGEIANRREEWRRENGDRAGQDRRQDERPQRVEPAAEPEDYDHRDDLRDEGAVSEAVRQDHPWSPG